MQSSDARAIYARPLSFEHHNAPIMDEPESVSFALAAAHSDLQDAEEAAAIANYEAQRSSKRAHRAAMSEARRAKRRRRQQSRDDTRPKSDDEDREGALDEDHPKGSSGEEGAVTAPPAREDNFRVLVRDGQREPGDGLIRAMPVTAGTEDFAKGRGARAKRGRGNRYW